MSDSAELYNGQLDFALIWKCEKKIFKIAVFANGNNMLSDGH